MKDSNRATIAYIAGRLISESKSSSIYDYGRGKYVNISGKIEDSKVNIYNYEKN